MHTINCLRVTLKHWLYGLKSALCGQGTAVVFVSALEESLGVLVMLSWLACQVVFVFKKCLLSSNKYWCQPRIMQYKVWSDVCFMPHRTVDSIMPVNDQSFDFLANSTY